MNNVETSETDLNLTYKQKQTHPNKYADAQWEKYLSTDCYSFGVVDYTALILEIVNYKTWVRSSRS